MKLVSRGAVERSRNEARTLFATGPTLKPYTVVVYCPARRSVRCCEDYYTEHVYAADRVDAAEVARLLAFGGRESGDVNDFLAVAVFDGHLCEADAP